MEELKCALCGDEDVRWNLDIRWNPHDLWFCDECKKKIENHIQAMVNAAEQERKARKRLEVIDVNEFSKIKEGKSDIVRTSEECPVGEVIDICYNGFAYKDSVECKVTGCYKSTSAGYILELSMQ